MKRLTGIFISLLLLFVFGCTERKAPGQSTAPENLQPLSGEPMESFPDTVGDLSFDAVTLDGRALRAGVIREYDLVVINCWADWCGPCVGELPELERVHSEHPNVLLIGLLCNPDSVDDAKAILSEAGVTYPAMEPVGSLVSLAKGVTAFPTTFFFDSTGHEIADPVIGARSRAEWNAIVEDLLP